MEENKIENLEVGSDWDRSGLPGWTYFSEQLFDLEKDLLFKSCWQFVCHVNAVKEVGSFFTIDIADERGFVLRGNDETLRAFHNLCPHRGSRVIADKSGRCNKSIVCPYHGWTFNLDGSLRGIARKETFPDLSSADLGLKPLDMEVWNGFVFVRFKESDQASVKDTMARFDKEIESYNLKTMVPVKGSEWSEIVHANWKSVRDVDNEGYHVRQAHPGLHELYGQNYFDEPFENGTSRSVGIFNKKPSSRWSVRNYLKFLPQDTKLPSERRDRWLYAGMFPNLVFGFYPDSVIYYLEIPIAPTKTLQRGGVLRFPDETRKLRISRYLSGRIDRDTAKEDQMLTIWSSEATKSSAYSGVILSDLEYGVKTYHDHLRKLMPVLKLNSEPAGGRLAEVNTEMLSTP
ncbi:MAG: aromatic ring-hydroxylating dioxygenase subunit alpha [Pseudomonadota bacterium]|nr:aromatic ring-hydroxylating dioxygenase subunit alpha [Pseudomonadota bacterium]